MVLAVSIVSIVPVHVQEPNSPFPAFARSKSAWSKLSGHASTASSLRCTLPPSNLSSTCKAHVNLISAQPSLDLQPPFSISQQVVARFLIYNNRAVTPGAPASSTSAASRPALPPSFRKHQRSSPSGTSEWAELCRPSFVPHRYRFPPWITPRRVITSRERDPEPRSALGDAAGRAAISRMWLVKTPANIKPCVSRPVFANDMRGSPSSPARLQAGSRQHHTPRPWSCPSCNLAGGVKALPTRILELKIPARPEGPMGAPAPTTRPETRQPSGPFGRLTSASWFSLKLAEIIWVCYSTSPAPLCLHPRGPGIDPPFQDYAYPELLPDLREARCSGGSETHPVFAEYHGAEPNGKPKGSNSQGRVEFGDRIPMPSTRVVPHHRGQLTPRRYQQRIGNPVIWTNGQGRGLRFRHGTSPIQDLCSCGIHRA